jgi:hypothetical protein
MSTQGTENGVRQALKASKMEMGMSAAAADAWVAANLAEGVTRFNAVSTLHRRDPMEGATEGFEAIKTWAQS